MRVVTMVASSLLSTETSRLRLTTLLTWSITVSSNVVGRTSGPDGSPPTFHPRTHEIESDRNRFRAELARAETVEFRASRLSEIQKDLRDSGSNPTVTATTKAPSPLETLGCGAFVTLGALAAVTQR